MTMEFPITEMLSIQVGDVAYYCTPELSGGFQSGTDLNEIGEITNIEQGMGILYVTCEVPASTPPPSSTDFIVFAKSSVANVSSLLGYYGLIRFKNDSTDKSEMFSVNCEFDQSSK